MVMIRVIIVVMLMRVVVIVTIRMLMPFLIMIVAVIMIVIFIMIVTMLFKLQRRLCTLNLAACRLWQNEERQRIAQRGERFGHGGLASRAARRMLEADNIHTGRSQRHLKGFALDGHIKAAHTVHMSTKLARLVRLNGRSGQRKKNKGSETKGTAH